MAFPFSVLAIFVLIQYAYWGLGPVIAGQTSWLDVGETWANSESVVLGILVAILQVVAWLFIVFSSFAILIVAAIGMFLSAAISFVLRDVFGVPIGGAVEIVLGIAILATPVSVVLAAMAPGMGRGVLVIAGGVIGFCYRLYYKARVKRGWRPRYGTQAFERYEDIIGPMPEVIVLEGVEMAEEQMMEELKASLLTPQGTKRVQDLAMRFSESENIFHRWFISKLLSVETEMEQKALAQLAAQNESLATFLRSFVELDDAQDELKHLGDHQEKRAKERELATRRQELEETNLDADILEAEQRLERLRKAKTKPKQTQKTDLERSLELVAAHDQYAEALRQEERKQHKKIDEGSGTPEDKERRKADVTELVNKLLMREE